MTPHVRAACTSGCVRDRSSSIRTACSLRSHSQGILVAICLLKLRALEVRLRPSQADIMWQVILHRLMSIQSNYDNQCAANPEAIETVQLHPVVPAARWCPNRLCPAPPAAPRALYFLLPRTVFSRRLSFPTSNCRAFLSACEEQVTGPHPVMRARLQPPGPMPMPVPMPVASAHTAHAEIVCVHDLHRICCGMNMSAEASLQSHLVDEL